MDKLEVLKRKTFEFLVGRARSYRRVFDLSTSDLDRRVVLEDLAKFCRAHQSPYVIDDKSLTDVMIGRQEVWLRIQQHLHLSDEDLYNLYNPDNPTRRE